MGRYYNEWLESAPELRRGLEVEPGDYLARFYTLRFVRGKKAVFAEVEVDGESGSVLVSWSVMRTVKSLLDKIPDEDLEEVDYGNYVEYRFPYEAVVVLSRGRNGLVLTQIEAPRMVSRVEKKEEPKESSDSGFPEFVL